jgi:FG-GAP repeat
VVGGALDSLGDLLHSGDLDGDGAPELVAGTELRGRYYRTHGAIVALADRRDRGPGEAWSWPAEYPLADIEIGDADGDGADDLVLAPLAGGSEVRTYLGPLVPGEPWGSDGSLVSGFSYGSKLTLGRLTDDGDPDLAFAIWQGRDERVGVLADPLLGGTSAFGVAMGIDGGLAPPEGDVAVQDIDGDGVDDLVTATACLYTGPVPSPPACVATPGTDRPISQSVAADVDGDGRADVAVAIGTSIYVHTSPWRDGAALGEGAWAEVDGVGFVKDVEFLRDGEALTLLRVDAADARGVPIDGPGLYEATDVWVEFDGPVPAVRAADLDQDGSPDLVLGFPEEDWMAVPSAGAVWVLWGS